MYKKKGEDPPCDTCMPKVLPENQEVWHIYLRVKNQAIMSMGGPVALDYNAVKLIMDMYKVEDQKTCFERVVNLWDRIRSQQAEMEKVKK